MFFGQVAGVRGGAARVAAGQYLGFAAILTASVIGAFGAGLLPESWLPYLGLLPLSLGLRAAWRLRRERRDGTDEHPAADDDAEAGGGVGLLSVAGVTLANGGDNIGVYVPVFTVVGPSGQIVFASVFLVLVAVWIVAGKFLATRPPVARALARWGHVLLPVVLIGIGIVILVEGGAFGL